jgi:hypothetical protein
MLVSVSATWKPLLGLFLFTTIVVSARARAPRRSLPSGDLRRLVVAALALYVVGAIAWLDHHLSLAVLVYAAGIVVAALTAWLSRGSDHRDPPSDDRPAGEPPAPDPGGAGFDWEAFERGWNDYAARSDAGAESRSGASG